MLLSREQILAALDCPTSELDVPEWGGTIRLITLGANDRIKWEEAAFPKGIVDMEQYLAGLVLRCAVDEAGLPLFTVDDLSALANKNPVVLRRVFDAAGALNGIGVDAAKAAEKNSEATPAEPGTSS